MGAAGAALYTTVYKYLRRGEGRLWQTFWSAFRENLRRSTLVWLAALGVLALLAAVLIVLGIRYRENREETPEDGEPAAAAP